MMGFGKPKLYTKFEVASFSRCRNIKANPKILGSSPSPWPCALFFWCDFMMALGKPKLYTKFEVAIFSRCGNIKGESQNLGSSPNP